MLNMLSRVKNLGRFILIHLLTAFINEIIIIIIIIVIFVKNLKLDMLELITCSPMEIGKLDRVLINLLLVDFICDVVVLL